MSGLSPAETAPRQPTFTREQGTQTTEQPTPGRPANVDASCSAMVPERLVAERYARQMGLFLGKLDIQEHKWWHHFAACMRMVCVCGRGVCGGVGVRARLARVAAVAMPPWHCGAVLLY